MHFFHGSNRSGLTILDPQQGILDPNDWAGVDIDGNKIDGKVVWFTNNFEIAIAFALKDFVDDLAVDGQAKILYVKSKQALDSTMKGFVYRISPETELIHVNELESYTCDPVQVVSCETVSIDSFQTYTVRCVEKFPFE